MPHKPSPPLEITKIVFQGFGLTHLEGRPLFVPKTVPGDVVTCGHIRRRKGVLFGKVESLITPSPLRQTAPCPHASLCGGCHYMDISYANQLTLKSQLLDDIFNKHYPDIAPICSPIVPCESPFYYRNKMEFAFSQSESKITLGLKQQDTYSMIVPITHCHLMSEESNSIVEFTQSFFNENPLPVWDSHAQTGCLRHLMVRHSKATDTYMLNLIAASHPPIFDTYASLVMKKFSNVVSVNHIAVHEQKGTPTTTTCHHLAGSRTLFESIGDLSFEISPLSFFQTNSLQATILYDTIRSLCEISSSDTLLDLYCGAGTIGLYVARNTCPLIGIEEVEDAIANAKKNAIHNQISDTEFIAGRVKNILKFNTFSPTHVIIDPPRCGMAPKALKRVIDLKSPTVIYVSCNPVTLLRDLHFFTEAGYHVDAFIPVDMFPHTFHIESVVKLTLH